MEAAHNCFVLIRNYQQSIPIVLESESTRGKNDYVLAITLPSRLTRTSRHDDITPIRY